MPVNTISDLIRATNRLNRALLAIRKTSVELELKDDDYYVADLVQFALEQFEHDTKPPTAAATAAA
jgi:hypothetical protein